MAERLLIRRDSRAGADYQWLRLADPEHSMQNGDLAQLAQAATDFEAVLLLPAAMVLLVEVDLPVKNTAQLRQALPFALEDRLADEVENYHLVWLRQPNQRLAVAAVDKQAFSDCIGQFRQAGVNLVAVYPESLCLPYQPGECSLLVEGDQAWFRYSPWLGGGIDLLALPLMLNSLQNEGLDCKALTVWGEAGLQHWAAEQAWAYQQQPLGQPLLLSAEQLQAITGLNLLTAEYTARPVSNRQQLKRWLPAVGLLALALALQLTWQLRLNWQLQAEIQQLEQQTQALFKATFPDIKRIVNVRVQADQRLQEMQKQRQAGDSEFLRLLQASGEQLMQQPDLHLRGLNFADNCLQLRLQASEEAQLQQFNQTLQSVWSVNMQTLEKSAQGVEAQIDVKQR